MCVSHHGFIPYLRLMQYLSLQLHAKSISPQPAWPQIVISLMLLIVVNYGLNKSCCTHTHTHSNRVSERESEEERLKRLFCVYFM